jgi:hypothetical protein
VRLPVRLSDTQLHKTRLDAVYTFSVIMSAHSSKHIALDESRLFFSRLPREIRDKIYHYLWSTVFLAFRHNRLVTIGHYDTNSGYSVVNSLSSWLMTNYQFLDEGMQQFCCYAQSTVGKYNTLPLYFEPLQGRHLSRQEFQLRQIRSRTVNFR